MSTAGPLNKGIIILHIFGKVLQLVFCTYFFSMLYGATCPKGPGFLETGWLPLSANLLNLKPHFLQPCTSFQLEGTKVLGTWDNTICNTDYICVFGSDYSSILYLE